MAFVGFLDHWQTLLGALAAGALGYAAALWTVQHTLRTESRKDARELDSMKTALGAEVRQFAGHALQGHNAAVSLATGQGNFAVQRLEDLARFPEPIIYPNSAIRLGLIGDDAHWVVYFFAQIQHFRQGVVILKTHPTPQSITPVNAESSADALLDACEAAVFVLSTLRRGSYYQIQDERFAEAVATARIKWKRDRKLSRDLEKGRG